MGTGSQLIVNPKWGPILGHDLGPDQVKYGYWVDQIAAVSLGTGTAKTKLGGTQVEGTSADYLIPTAARCIIAARPKHYLAGLPTANQAVLSTLKIESSDLGMKDWEFLANPLDSGLGTNEMQIQDAAPWYPLMQPCDGGEKMQFFGTPQIANTVAPLMSVDVLISDTPPEGYDGKLHSWGPRNGYAMGPVQSKVAGINYGGGPTSTGTAAATPAVDGGVTIAGPKRRLIGLQGAVVGTTPAAQKGIAGQFTANASEIAINPQRWNAEPITGFLGTTTTGALAHLSEVGPLNVALRAPSTPKGTFTLDVAITTAGNFEVGYVYIDNP